MRSYRDLPLMLFHIQTKERDEPRPRAGVLRTREFTMKDAYSFDRDEEGLARSYELQAGAYERILDRCGLRWYRVESDVGMMGGSGAHEYMAPCPAGENEVALAPGYAANVEVASAEAQPVELPPALAAPEPVSTPGLTTVEEVSGALEVPRRRLIKALPVIVEGRGMVLVLLRGDHRLNEIKLRNALGADFRQAEAEEIEAELGPVGFIGPVGAKVPVLKDAAIAGDSYVCGANEPDTHLRGVQPGRDFEFEELDVRTVEAGDTAPAAARSRSSRRSRSATSSSSAPATRSRSAPPSSTRTGKERPIVMGSYGIGPARIVAAAIEQGADERGIVWPPALAPWQVHLVSLAKAGEPEREAADRLYEELRGLGAEVLYDDRDAGPGEKLTDAELLGCPLRIVVGRRGLAEGVVEASERATGAEHKLPVEEAAERALRSSRGSMADAAPFGRGRVRRLFGLDRSGPKPRADPQGRAAQPLDDPQPRRLRPPRGAARSSSTSPSNPATGAPPPPRSSSG